MGRYLVLWEIDKAHEYVPYIDVEVHPLITISQVDEIIKALSG